MEPTQQRVESPAQDARRNWFVALVIYYVLALYLIPSSAKVERFSFTYFATVVPAWMYIAANWRYLLSGYTWATRLLLAFALLAGFLGLARDDHQLAYNAVFLATMGIVVLNSKVQVSVAELNKIMLACVVGSIAVYAFGLTEYGFLPGQAYAPGCHAAMNWRVSLFRVTAESATFALLILLANIAYGQRLDVRMKGVVAFLAAYFLLYSGVRSVAILAMFFVPAYALSALREAAPKARLRIAAGTVAGAMVILSVPFWLGASDGFWENYFFKTKTCDFYLKYGFDAPSAEQTSAARTTRLAKLEASVLDPNVKPGWYAWTINRHCAAMFELQTFVGAPLGTPKVEPHSGAELVGIGCPADQFAYFCASCNFSTYWLARAGVTAIPLLLCFVVLIANAIRTRDFMQAGILAAFGVVSTSWGVMFVPYNFIFLLMLAVPALAATNGVRRLE